MRINYAVQESRRKVTAFTVDYQEGIFNDLIKSFRAGGIYIDPMSLVTVINKLSPSTMSAHAYQHPEDTFNEAYGCELAKSRLLKQYYQYKKSIYRKVIKSLLIVSTRINDEFDMMSDKHTSIKNKVDVLKKGAPILNPNHLIDPPKNDKLLKKAKSTKSKTTKKKKVSKSKSIEKAKAKKH